MAHSVLANIATSGFLFLAGLLAARGLGPRDYGRFFFLLGSFESFRSLLDCGCQQAFFTFCSTKRRTRRFFSLYFFWLTLQTLIPLVVIGFLLPDRWIARLWVNESRGLILLAFLAYTFRQVLWNTITIIGESYRKTLRVQWLTALWAMFYFAGLFVLWRFYLLNLISVFLLIIFDYGAALLIGYVAVGKNYPFVEDEGESVGKILSEYVSYCAPLVVLSLFSFLSVYLDRWLLQYFGGASQQGYFGIAFRLVSVSALLMTAVTQIFWKELADAAGRNDNARLRIVFQRITRFLFSVSAVMSALFIPWARDILTLTVGAAYGSGTVAFTILLIYPIFQSLGRFSAIYFHATCKTKTLTVITILRSLIGIVLLYFLVAPPDNPLPGLGAGAVGLALKTVLLQILFVNLMLWYIHKQEGWRFEWKYELLIPAAACALSFALRGFIDGLIPVSPLSLGFVVIPASALRIALSALLFFPSAASVFFLKPHWFGLTRGDLKQLLSKISSLLRLNRV